MNFVVDYPEEGKRLQFLFERDGLAKTVIFASQTMKLYKTAILRHLPPCANKDYRIKYVRAYNEFKRFNALYNVTNAMIHYV